MECLGVNREFRLSESGHSNKVLIEQRHSFLCNYFIWITKRRAAVTRRKQK